MSEVVGYARWHPTEGLEVDLESQRKAMDQLAASHGLKVEHHLTDNTPHALTLGRAGMQTLMLRLDRGDVGTLLVYRLDRLTQNPVDLDVLARRFQFRAVRVLSVCETWLDTLEEGWRERPEVQQLELDWAETAEDPMASQCPEGSDRRTERGADPEPQFGYRQTADGSVVQDRNEQQIIAMLQELQRYGLTLPEIAVELKRQGFLRNSLETWKGEYARIALTHPIPPYLTRSEWSERFHERVKRLGEKVEELEPLRRGALAEYSAVLDRRCGVPRRSDPERSEGPEKTARR